MPDKTERINPFAAGLEEWEHPLGRQPRTRGAVRTKGAVRVRGLVKVAGGSPAAESEAAPPVGGGECFRKGLEDWEHPLGQRR